MTDSINASMENDIALKEEFEQVYLPGYRLNGYRIGATFLMESSKYEITVFELSPAQGARRKAAYTAFSYMEACLCLAMLTRLDGARDPDAILQEVRDIWNQSTGRYGDTKQSRQSWHAELEYKGVELLVYRNKPHIRRGGFEYCLEIDPGHGTTQTYMYFNTAMDMYSALKGFICCLRNGLFVVNQSVRR